MGNIADALKKAGVDLGTKDIDAQEPDDDLERADVKGEKGTPASVTDELQTTRTSEGDFHRDIDHQHGVNGDVGYADDWDERIRLVLEKDAPSAEAFRILRSRILYPESGEAGARTILIASSAPKEGKSFVAVNLAIAIAQGLDQYALLVDCDLRRPSVAQLLGIEGKADHGLSEYLQGRVGIADILLKTSVAKLSVLPSGQPPLNPAELLSSERMGKLIDELADRYPDRFIIFDSAPFLVASESNVLTRKVDGVVIVVRYGTSDREKIRAMIDSIGEDKILGVVFNGQEQSYIKKKVFDRYGHYGDYYSAKNK